VLDTESSEFSHLWITAFAGMTVFGLLTSSSNNEMYDFIKGYILKYDLAIISNEKYRMKNLPVEQRIVYPAIDPLSSKNMELSQEDIAKYLHKFGIKTDKPLLMHSSKV
jgi:trehalose synthase